MLKNAQVSVDGDRIEVVHSVELAGSELTVMLAFTEAEARAYLATIGAAVDQLAGVRPTRDRLVVPANDHYDGGPFIRSI